MINLLAQHDTKHLMALVKKHNHNALEAYQTLLAELNQATWLSV